MIYLTDRAESNIRTMIKDLESEIVYYAGGHYEEYLCKAVHKRYLLKKLLKEVEIDD